MSELAIRVVVTGTDGRGRSMIVSNEVTQIGCPHPAYPGYAIGRLWPLEGSAPPSGVANFIAFQFPPEDEILPRLPELQKLGGAGSISLEEESFGMHQNQSVDYIIVMSGEIWLRVGEDRDEEKEVHLSPGDVVVQGGARHAWRNRGAGHCLMLGVIVRPTD